MKTKNQESKLLASLALFRELYDSKKDIYEVIAEFIKEVVVSKAKYQFNITELTIELNTTYEFSLPEAVVNASINKLDFIKKSDGLFVVDNIQEIKKSILQIDHSEIEQSNSNLIEGLFNFIAEEKKEKLSEIEKEKIIDSFCSFIIDDFQNQNYSNYISAYIIKNQHNELFVKQLRIIKEGVILYTGLKYSDSNLYKGEWNTYFTIFIDTEVLFYFAGYDGELYKTLFIDFLNFVNEINNNASNQLIKLSYFRDVKDEIERFFAKAEQIVSGKEKLIPSKTAMSSIVNGCKTPSDVIEKKSIFFDLLYKAKILEDDFEDYFKPDNKKYNISDLQTIEKISKDLQREDIYEHIRFLNFVSIRRQDKINNNFENIGFILLSGNTLTQKVAWHKEIKKEGLVPLVTNLSFITNKLWFKLNKSFGNGDNPKSFDVITKAQIVLSTQLNESVCSQFEVLQEKHKRGELTEEQAVSTIANLRQQAKKPEEIVESNITNVLSYISDTNIERYILEHEHIKCVAHNSKKENLELKLNLDSKKKELEDKTLEVETYKREMNEKEIEILNKEIYAKQILLNSKKENQATLNTMREPLLIKANISYRNYKIRFVLFVILLYVLICFIIYNFSWEILEVWTYVIGIFISNIIPIIYLLVFEKNINPLDFLKEKKNSIIMKKYLEFNFNISKLDTLNREIESIENEIKELKKASTQQGL